jgi:hypothetical protein
VEAARLEDDAQIVIEKRPAQNIVVSVEQITWTLVLVYNRLLVSIEQLCDLIEATGFTPAHAQFVTRLGKPIVIPPDVTG